MAAPKVALLHLAQSGGLGARRRVESMREVFTAAGAEVVELALRRQFPVRLRDLAHSDLIGLLRGRIVPESLSWSLGSVLQSLDRHDPTLVVCNTARAFHPSLAERWPVVLDYVDRLSVSYRDRSRLPGRPARRLLYRLLTPAAGRFERRARPGSVTTVAAGWRDAEDLGATWVPNTVHVKPLPTRAPAADVLFFGTLSYPPNVEAVEWIDRFWPAVLQRRPGTTLLLAGATPSARVLELAARHGWRVWADFPDLTDLLSTVHIAIAPLAHASGIQSKVLEAAAFGVPQVLSPAASAGLAPGFPAPHATDDAAWAERIAELLDDTSRREALGAAARAHVAQTYSVERWAKWAEALLDAMGR